MTFPINELAAGRCNIGDSFEAADIPPRFTRIGWALGYASPSLGLVGAAASFVGHASTRIFKREGETTWRRTI